MRSDGYAIDARAIRQRPGRRAQRADISQPQARKARACRAGTNTIKARRRTRRLKLAAYVTSFIAMGAMLIAIMGYDAGTQRYDATYAATTGSTAEPIEILVQDGATLWSIAATLNDGSRDNRDIIAEIRELNNFTTDHTLTAGDTILVPRMI
jgi:ferric-dicitrate binding protein FerR (iron transport regulator)